MGTTLLTVGLAALAVHDAERIVRAADATGAFTTEVTMGTTAACDTAIHEVRPHAGQVTSAQNVRRVTKGSELIESHRNCDRVQDAYSIRCLPQVHGAVRDATDHLRESVEIELNSATDNPFIFATSQISNRMSGAGQSGVLSGGNFHGEPLALRLDYLVSAVTELGAISERRVDRLLNPHLQESYLPPFLTENSGLESGYMIAQYTTAALLNENRSIGRASMDNTPVSGGQEDHVSMSAQAAFNVRTAIDNSLRIIATELLCASQAAEFVTDAPEVKNFNGDNHPGHGVGTKAIYETVRNVVPPLEGDRIVQHDVDAVENLIHQGVIDQALERELDMPLL